MHRVFLILILFIASITSYGINAHEKTKYADGYIITLEQDTLFGSIRIEVDNNDEYIPSRFENKVVFIPDSGNRTTYIPGSIKYFYFFYNFEMLTFASVPYYNGYLFMKVISEKGFLKLYRFYPDKDLRISSAFDLAEIAYGTNFDKAGYFYILKPDGSFLFLGKHTHKRKITTFFKEDPLLAEKIASGEYKYTDVYRIVREYNRYMTDTKS